MSNWASATSCSTPPAPTSRASSSSTPRRYCPACARPSGDATPRSAPHPAPLPAGGERKWHGAAIASPLPARGERDRVRGAGRDMIGQLTITGLKGVPFVKAGDDLAAIALAAYGASGLAPEDGDVLVVAQKIVSKAEDRVVDVGS